MGRRENLNGWKVKGASKCGLAYFLKMVYIVIVCNSFSLNVMLG